MSLKLQVLLIISCMLSLIIIINMIRKGKLELKYSLLWLISVISILVISIIPKSIEIISSMIGIFSAMNGLFFIAIVFELLILFSLTVAISRLVNKLNKVAQEVALLDKKMGEGSNKNEKY